MLTGILKKNGKLCSLKAPQGATRNKWKGGFTLVELMVVIIIVNLLSGIAIPKCTDLIEKAREKIDLMTLYQLRDAINRHMYESDIFSVANAKDTAYASKLSKWLADGGGAALFVIELHNVMPANYQGTHHSANSNNISELMYKGGFLKDVFDEAGLGAIGDIVEQRFKYPNQADSIKGNSRYVAQTVSNGAGKDYVRTYPTSPVFKSRILNKSSSYSGTNQYRIAFKIQWTNKNPNSHSVEVFIGNGKTSDSDGRWDSALLSCHGVCFSTYGMAKGCKKSTCIR